ncbi:YceD family protein [Methylocystis sp. JR02]|uniref:YceD family protein n=1 Tax=Methylocystis sp. JR02 TaxID=3046284 RepID=UPI0024BAEF37|nr:YceD family protein [Methylocystis sp. JR02]MDJ0448264.1 YceD family protein [Methylocystis sp. JR02]
MIDEHNMALGEKPPFSRPLTLTEVPPEGLEIKIAATDAERAALAQMNGLPAVLSLEAALRARRWRGDGLEVTGELRAHVRQTCVVTLDEFDSEVVEPIELRFAPPKEAPKPRSRRHEPEPEAIEQNMLDDDPPDPLLGGAVDLGAVVSEFLTLTLDPYPRKPGAEFVEPAPEAEEEGGVVSPFAKLRPAGK